VSAAVEKTFESKLADLVRRFGTEFEGEVIAVWRALKRLLGSRNVTFTELGDAIERLATGNIDEADIKRLFEAGYAKGVADTRREQAQAQAVFGLRSDGTPDWEPIALHCQREKSRLENRHHEFVDKMASRMTWGRDPTDREGKYLLSLFRQLGGRCT
jgi:hypothetical protein